MGKTWDRLAGRLLEPLDTTPREGPDRNGFYNSAGTERVRYAAGAEAQEWHERWAREALRVLKPGGYLLAFGGTRTYHRLVCAVEDAGFEIRDRILVESGEHDDVEACQCGREAVPEHDVRSVPDADLSASVNAEDQQGEVLLAGVPEPGACPEGAVPATREPGSEERLVEGRRDVQTPEGELRDGAVCAGADVGAADGAQGRLRDGASARDGGVDRSCADEDGGRASSGSRSAEQRAVESRTVADERGSQAVGVGPYCSWCGKPRRKGVIAEPHPVEVDWLYGSG